MAETLPSFFDTPSDTGGSNRRRFLRLVHKVCSIDGCWIWLGKSMRFRLYGNSVSARRAAYLLFGKRPLPSVSVRQGCAHPDCVNPDHAMLSVDADRRRAEPRPRPKATTHILMLAEERARRRRQSWEERKGRCPPRTEEKAG